MLQIPKSLELKLYCSACTAGYSIPIFQPVIDFDKLLAVGPNYASLLENTVHVHVTFIISHDKVKMLIGCRAANKMV